MLREYKPPTREILGWVARQVHPHGRVIAVARLQGGLTADMDRVTVEFRNGLRDLVLRRWPGEDREEGLVMREASALAAVFGRGENWWELVNPDGGIVLMHYLTYPEGEAVLEYIAEFQRTRPGELEIVNPLEPHNSSRTASRSCVVPAARGRDGWGPTTARGRTTTDTGRRGGSRHAGS